MFHLRSSSLRECSHGFCLACLRTWFQRLIYDDIRHTPFPPGLDERIRNPPYTAESLAKLYHHKVIKFAYFRCPYCQESVWDRPIEIPIVNQVIRLLSATYLGLPADSASFPGDIDPNDLWAGIFPADN
ncbi:hypothetical protein JVT61DRAFT_5059 [Boletus reticuloceps]|uniref:Zinc finger C3HC4 RING-type domain-containing protein n=1 Tax=Boletus reticuloceps TaxID=495285 RepID=A0A8I2YZ79_9AGAM|nr:hypothetical protein JVT61DRAFT_5059 [Boletus reticuloceps]